MQWEKTEQRCIQVHVTFWLQRSILVSAVQLCSLATKNKKWSWAQFKNLGFAMCKMHQSFAHFTRTTTSRRAQHTTEMNWGDIVDLIHYPFGLFDIVGGRRSAIAIFVLLGAIFLCCFPCLCRFYFGLCCPATRMSRSTKIIIAPSKTGQRSPESVPLQELWLLCQGRN